MGINPEDLVLWFNDKSEPLDAPYIRSKRTGICLGRIFGYGNKRCTAVMYEPCGDAMDCLKVYERLTEHFRVTEVHFAPEPVTAV